VHVDDVKNAITVDEQYVEDSDNKVA
jgi:hypothetical protein